MRTPVAALVVVLAALGFIGLSAMPVASADTLPNGMTVSCVPSFGNSLTCVIGGCPRVGDDHNYNPDVVHARLPTGFQDELPLDCINNLPATETVPLSSIPSAGFVFGVQVCRKVAIGHDMCGPWSNYTYRPPPAPAPPQGPPAAQGQRPTSQEVGTVIGGDLAVWDIAHNDVPDPATGVRGATIGTLTNGSQVALDRPCHDGFCHVTSNQIPRGDGFVEQDRLQIHGWS